MWQQFLTWLRSFWHSAPKVIRVPRVYLTVGDIRNGEYPIYYSATGENGLFVLVASIHPPSSEAYEIMCTACEAYNEARNNEASRGE